MYGLTDDGLATLATHPRLQRATLMGLPNATWEGAAALALGPAMRQVVSRLAVPRGALKRIARAPRLRAAMARVTQLRDDSGAYERAVADICTVGERGDTCVRYTCARAHSLPLPGFSRSLRSLSLSISLERDAVRSAAKPLSLSLTAYLSRRPAASRCSWTVSLTSSTTARGSAGEGLYGTALVIAYVRAALGAVRTYMVRRWSLAPRAALKK